MNGLFVLSDSYFSLRILQLCNTVEFILRTLNDGLFEGMLGGNNFHHKINFYNVNTLQHAFPKHVQQKHKIPKFMAMSHPIFSSVLICIFPEICIPPNFMFQGVWEIRAVLYAFCESKYTQFLFKNLQH